MASDQAESSVPAASASGTQERKALSMMSKKRFVEICEGISGILCDEEVPNHEAVHARIKKLIEDVMCFDINASNYTKKEGQQKKEYMRKQREKNKIANAVALVATLKKEDIDKIL